MASRRAGGKGPEDGKRKGSGQGAKANGQCPQDSPEPGHRPSPPPGEPRTTGQCRQRRDRRATKRACQTQGKTKQPRTGQETETCCSPAERKKSPNPTRAGDLQQNTRSAEWGGGWPRAQGAWSRVLGTHPVRVCKRGKARNGDSGTMMGSCPDKTQVRSPSCPLHQNTV